MCALPHLLALFPASRPLGPLGVDRIDVEVEAGDGVAVERGCGGGGAAPFPVPRAPRGTALVQRAKDVPQLPEPILPSAAVALRCALQCEAKFKLDNSLKNTTNLQNITHSCSNQFISAAAA